MSADRLTALPLPASGRFLVGRSPLADLRLDDPEVDVEHLSVTVDGGGFAVEDLGSAGGTLLREARLSIGQASAFMPGEPIRLGATVLMIRRRTTGLALRRLWSPAEFRGLVEDECLRAQRRLAVFAVVHLRLDSGPAGSDAPAPGTIGLGDLLGRLDRALPPPHVLGAGPGGALQALLVAVRPRDMGEALGRLTEILHTGGCAVGVGAAWFPRDARTPDLLLDLARHRAGDPGEPGPPTPPARWGQANRAAQADQVTQAGQGGDDDPAGHVAGHAGRDSSVAAGSPPDAIADAVHREGLDFLRETAP